jgi:hypothetical protein
LIAVSSWRIIALAAIASVTLATGASGELPTPRTTEIDPSTPSLGGLELGMSRDQVKDQWGRDFECFPDPGHVDCEYVDPSFRHGHAGISFQRNALVKADINAGNKDSGEFNFHGPLSSLETTRRIHIGSSFRRVRAAYPKARTLHEDSSATVSVIVAGPGDSYTYFVVSGKNERHERRRRRVFQIGMTTRSFCAPQMADFCRLARG